MPQMPAMTPDRYSAHVRKVRYTRCNRAKPSLVRRRRFQWVRQRADRTGRGFAGASTRVGYAVNKDYREVFGATEES